MTLLSTIYHRHMLFTYHSGTIASLIVNSKCNISSTISTAICLYGKACIRTNLCVDLRAINPSFIISSHNRKLSFVLPTGNKITTNINKELIKSRHLHEDQNDTIEDTPTFRDFRNILTVTKKGECDLIDPDFDENATERELIDVDVFMKKAEKLLQNKAGLDFRSNSHQENVFKLLVTQQPTYHNKWLKAIWQRPGLLQHNHSAESLLGLIDFAITALQLSKNKAFSLLNVMPHDLISMLRPVEMNISEYLSNEQGSSVDVATALINWQALCERYELDAVDTLSDVPEILYVPTQLWQDRISDLSEYFNHRRHIGDLIKNNASAVLLEGLPELKKKLDYFIKVMHVDVEDIAKCKALTKDLEEIKQRYLFLDRAGLYRHPVANDIGSIKSAKPRLYKIAETPADQFLERVVFPAGGDGLTQAEYDAFVMSLTPEELSQNIYDDANKTGYEELVDALEEENWHSEHGYYAPYFREDIKEAREHNKGYRD